MKGHLGKEYLKKYLRLSDPLFEKYLKTKEKESAKNDPLAGEIIKRFTEIARRGKKIRGALVTLGYQAGGGAYDKKIIDASLFIELFHAGVLVQDDIQDRGDFRRGISTLHRQFEKRAKQIGVKINKYHYGEAIAMDAMTSAYYFSWEKLLGSDFPQDRLIKSGLMYSKFIQRLSDGQSLDITGASTKKTNERFVLNMLKLKSAEYTGILPLLSGAILAGVTDKKRLNAIEKFGLAFGWAFQIQDDILGLYGDEKEFGKPVGSDIIEGKNTLFMLYLAENGTPEQVRFMKRVLGNSKAKLTQIKKLKNILVEAGAYDHVVARGWKYVEQGKKYIPQITDDPKIREILESLIIYMMERTL